MKSSLQKVWNVISTIIVAIVVILALLLVGARVVGLQEFTVLSGSMEPTYHTGSLIYVKKVDPYTIEPGQPITFMLDETPSRPTGSWASFPMRRIPRSSASARKATRTTPRTARSYIIKM